MTVINTRNAETMNITSNGTYDVARYTTANVNVGAPKLCVQKTKDANGKIVGGSTIIDLDGATDVGDYALQYLYYNDTAITGTVDLSSLITLSGIDACYNMFSGCTGITSVDLSSLITISGGLAASNMFNGCTGITSVDISSLTTVSGSCSYMFRNCRNLTTVNLSSLTEITNGNGCEAMFYGCGGITGSIVFSSLNSIIASKSMYRMFFGCLSLTSLSFPALKSTSFGSNTNQFYEMLKSVTGCTVHFPSNLQSVIGNWADVTAGFGGTNTTVLYDLPATE